MDFADYQALARQTDRTQGRFDEEARLIPLLGLAGEAGQLLSEYKKRLRDGPSHELFVDRVAEELGDILWYVSTVATKYGLALGDVADANLTKTRARYLSAGEVPSLDARYGVGEQFPRRFTIRFEELRAGERVEVRAYLDDVVIGAALTDNAYQDDGYRFHDVFHLAHAAVLGWSPVLRRLLDRKRRSDRAVDEVEDGGRAAVIEEGIVAVIFDYARSHAFLKGVVGVDESLLRTVRGMSAHLEVAARPDTLWTSAILQGFEAWREVVANGGGAVEADLDRQTLRYLGS